MKHRNFKLDAFESIYAPSLSHRITPVAVTLGAIAVDFTCYYSMMQGASVSGRIMDQVWALTLGCLADLPPLLFIPMFKKDKLTGSFPWTSLILGAGIPTVLNAFSAWFRLSAPHRFYLSNLSLDMILNGQASDPSMIPFTWITILIPFLTSLFSGYLSYKWCDPVRDALFKNEKKTNSCLSKLNILYRERVESDPLSLHFEEEEERDSRNHDTMVASLCSEADALKVHARMMLAEHLGVDADGLDVLVASADAVGKPQPKAAVPIGVVRAGS